FRSEQTKLTVTDPSIWLVHSRSVFSSHVSRVYLFDYPWAHLGTRIVNFSSMRQPVLGWCTPPPRLWCLGRLDRRDRQQTLWSRRFRLAQILYRRQLHWRPAISNTYVA